MKLPVMAEARSVRDEDVIIEYVRECTMREATRIRSTACTHKNWVDWEEFI